MKKLGKVSATLLLLFALVLSLASCDLIFPNRHRKGYTGGLSMESHFYTNREIHWVETYEEAMFAIERLKAAGNKIEATISTYENEYVDAKYYFILNTYNSKRLKKGQEWYDREELTGVGVYYVGFLEEITIEELEYSKITKYKSFRLWNNFDTNGAFNPDEEYTYLYGVNGGEDRLYEFAIRQNGYIYACFKCHNMTPQDLIESGLVEGFKTEFPKSIVILNTTE